VFYVPPQARWKWLQGRAKLPTIGKDIDDAMDAIEKDNPTLKGVLPKYYAKPALDKQRFGELIDLISSITLSKGGNGKGKNVLGVVFEYFLGQFAKVLINQVTFPFFLLILFYIFTTVMYNHNHTALVTHATTRGCAHTHTHTHTHV